MTKQIYIIILTAIIVILLMFTCQSRHNNKLLQEKITLQEQIMDDSITTYKNKKGELESKIAVLQSTNLSMFTNLQHDSEIINKLQNKVKQYKKRLDNQSSVTVVETKFQLDTVIQTDSVVQYVEVQDTTFPEYSFSFNDSWVSLDGKVNPLNTQLDLSIEDKYSVAIVKSKKGYEAIVSSENPYMKTKDIKAYKLSGIKPKRFGIGFQAGYGVTIENNVIKAFPYFGIGATFNVLKF